MKAGRGGFGCRNIVEPFRRTSVTHDYAARLRCSHSMICIAAIAICLFVWHISQVVHIAIGICVGNIATARRTVRQAAILLDQQYGSTAKSRGSLFVIELNGTKRRHAPSTLLPAAANDWRTGRIVGTGIACQGFAMQTKTPRSTDKAGSRTASRPTESIFDLLLCNGMTDCSQTQILEARRHQIAAYPDDVALASGDRRCAEQLQQISMYCSLWS